MNTRIFLLTFLLTGIAVAGCSQDRPVNHSNIAMDITVQQFTEMTGTTPGTILDVRTPAEVEKGAIPESVHIDFYDEDFMERVNQLDKNKPVYVYCAAGGRSGQAKEMMTKAGFREVYNMAAGYGAWKKKNPGK